MGLRYITVDRVNDPVDIYASDDSRIYASIMGGEGIHHIGSCMDAEAVGSNQLRISDGVASIQGRIAIIDPEDSETVTMDAGVSGYKRNDLVVLDFMRNGNDEIITLQAVKGTQGTVGTDPKIIQQDLTRGGTHRQVPLWRVKFNGTLIEGVERYGEIQPNIVDCVKTQQGSIDLIGGTDLQTFFKTAKDFVCYRKAVGTTVYNGIPDSTNDLCSFLKMRTYVIGFNHTDDTLWFATYTDERLSAFEKNITSGQISTAKDVETPGEYVPDAVLIKQIFDELKNCTKNGYISPIAIPSGTDLQVFLRDAKVFTPYSKQAGIAIHNGIPDSDGSFCNYITLGYLVLGYRLSDQTYWMNAFFNTGQGNVLAQWIEISDTVLKKYVGDNFIRNTRESLLNVLTARRLVTYDTGGTASTYQMYAIEQDDGYLRLIAPNTAEGKNDTKYITVSRAENATKINGFSVYNRSFSINAGGGNMVQITPPDFKDGTILYAFANVGGVTADAILVSSVAISGGKVRIYFNKNFDTNVTVNLEIHYQAK